MDSIPLLALHGSRGRVGLALSDVLPPAGDPPKLASNLAAMRRASGNSPEAAERRWELFRENVRRFTAGEPLLCVVERKGN